MNFNSSKHSNPNPKLTANILSKITLSWLVSLFWYGRKHNLEAKDIYDVLPENESERVSEMLSRSWHEQIKMARERGCKPSLFKAVAKTFYWPTICYAVLLTFGHLVIRQSLPMTIDYYTKYFATKPSIWTGVGSASLLVVSFYAMIIILIHCELKLQEIGMRAKIACSCLIYQKMTRLSCASMAQIDEGHIINLLSNDVVKWEPFFMYVHFGWIAPIQLIVTAYIIGVKIKIAAIIGIAAVVLQTLPAQGALSRIIYLLRKKAAVATDRRILMIKEIIHGIRVVKMYCWEKSFEKFVLLSRKREMKLLKLLSFAKVISLSLFVVTMRNSLFAAILSYFFIEGKFMSTENIFGIWRYFIILQMTINTFLPQTVTSVSEVMIAVKRIEKFLLLEEMKATIQYYPKVADNHPSVSIRGVSLAWGTVSSTNILSDVDIKIFSKQLYVVIGPTGAGKSSLIKLILGELQPNAGTVSVHGKISYSSQEPWLFPGSVKDNILLGEIYDEARYRNVTNACALREDFNQLPNGDKTLVVDGGSMLSGGQRARINLARAVYRSADIYLLDDCLSAVDVSVGKVLYEKCFKSFLRDKSCILITHNLLYLDEEDQIILMNQGRIKYQGSFENYKNYHHNSQNLTNQINKQTRGNENVRKQSIIEKNSNEPAGISLDKKEGEVLRETEELRIKGKIATILYWKYLKSGGSYWMLFITAFTIILSQIFLNLIDFWVSRFSKINSANLNISSSETNETSSNFSSKNNNEEIYTALYIYGFLIGGCIITTFIRSLLFFTVCMNASAVIHNNMFTRVLRAPLSFFHVNNIGRIINRFSQDTGSVDDKLAASMLQIIQTVLGFIGVIIQICVVKWWLIFPMIIVGIIFTKIQQFYQATARDIRRLEGAAESPVFACVTSSFSGLLTIRSRKLEKLVLAEFNNLQNIHTSAYYLVFAGVSISSLWTEFLKNLLIASITYGFLFSNSSSESINFIYIQISLVLGVIGNIMRMFTEILVQMVNLERMFQFTEVEQEGSSESPAAKKPLNYNWPSYGCIQIDHLYLKYLGTTKPVLNNLNFSIQAGQRIGIVGRTGAGKSSLIAALFRLVDFEGCIYIDNVNIKQRSLQDVRSKISIIPQENLLFAMSLRENLDPNQDCTDEAIWSVLMDVGLNRRYMSLSTLLDKKQLSAGEIQLLSLARAIIRKNKIVVLDEATAMVDNEVDITVQNIIKNTFKDCTVIIVAHKLNTIIDCDKILVIDNGQLVEFDHPYILLKNDGGLFKKMALQSNDAAYENLKQIAEDVWYKKKI